MRFRNLFLGIFAAIAIFTTSCGKKNTLFSIGKETVSVFVGEEVSIALKNGVLPYKIENQGTTIVPATTEKNVLKIKGLTVGTATISISDNDGNSVRVAVKVGENPKDDAATRIIWDGKTESKGILIFKKQEESVTFTWQSANKKNSISLDFDDASNLIKRGAPVTADKLIAKKGTLRVEEEGQKASKHKISSEVLIKSITSNDRKNATYWIRFEADGKTGYCIGTI